MRPKGVVVYSSPENPFAKEAEKNQRQERIRLQTQRAERRQRRYDNAPNYICYPESFPPHLYDPKTGVWKGGILPPCYVCGFRLQPNEHHNCPGFTPKYVETTPERKERFEARREEIRETRREMRLRGVFCSVCGEHMEDPEDGQWHWDAHEGRPEREHYAIDGEPDGDMDGYDDEPEEDYCEGDDDGWDCD